VTRRNKQFASTARVRVEPRLSRAQLAKRALVGVLITGALIYFLGSFIDRDDIAQVTSRASWPLLTAGLGLYLLLYVIRAWRFIVIAPKTPFGVMLCIAALHNFLLRVMPLRTGDISYAFLVRRAGTAGFGDSLLGLLLLRMLDVTAVISLFGATLALNAAIYQADAHQGVLIAALATVVGGALVLAFPKLLRWGTAMTRRVLQLLRLNDQRRIRHVMEQLESAVEGQEQLRARSLAAAAVLTLINWLLNYAIVWLLMRAIAVDVSLAQAVLGSTAATVSAMLPLAGIGSFGTLEAGWTLGFVLVGLPRADAIVSGFAFSLVTFGYAILLAAVAWLALDRLARRHRAIEPHLS
jgi:uncharacterized protein (TIRG00374 family)